jgi:oligopeptide transport system substrate-binding protein
VDPGDASPQDDVDLSGAAPKDKAVPDDGRAVRSRPGPGGADEAGAGPRSFPPPDVPMQDASTLDGSASHGRRGWRRWLTPASLGTFLLLAIMLAAGILSAITVTPPPDEEALSRPAGVDVVVANAAPLSWDPATISDSASAQLLSQVYEGLTVLDAASQVRPALAQSWRVEDGGRRIVFTLREGLTFSDGSTLDASDVRRSWLRVLDPTAPSPLASLLEDVEGASAYAHGQATADEVGLQADGRTLTVDLVRPASFFPTIAAVPSLAVVPESAEQLTGGPRAGVPFAASGPYVPQASEPGGLQLRANEAYWAGDPPIARIGVVTDIGGRSEVETFEDGAVDWTSITPWDADWIRYDAVLGPQLREDEQMMVQYLGFDTSRPPFDDPAVRRAVAKAVDWPRLVTLDDPDAEVATSMVPPGLAARGEAAALPRYDPDGARADLAAAGYPGGAGFPTVSLATYGVGPAEGIAHDLRRELGIQVQVEERSFEDLSALLDSDTPALWTMAWSADYPHANDFLGLLLRSGSSANEGHWSNADYDALIDAAGATADTAEQASLYDEAAAILRREVPVVPLAYGRSWALSRDGLRGADVSGVGLLRYADLAWDR